MINEVFLLCPRTRAYELARLLTAQFMAASVQARVLVCGAMCKHTLKGTGHAGFILLEWVGTVPSAFLSYLDADINIYGYAIYQATRFTIPAIRASEP